ncbi:MAG TPA: M15 family metallopeptidase [Clostridiales bacterium]|nr:M15 family metallopeptidase [Clostridiales bacterium]
MLKNSIKIVWRNQVWIVLYVVLLSCLIEVRFLTGDKLAFKQQGITAEGKSDILETSETEACYSRSVQLSNVQAEIAEAVPEYEYTEVLSQSIIGNYSASSRSENETGFDESIDDETTDSDEENEKENNYDVKPDNTEKPKINTANENPDAIDVLVNRTYILPSSYVPSNLVIPDVPFTPKSNYRLLREEAAAALEEMFKSALDDGIKLYAHSGYRSYINQKGIFQKNVSKYGSVEKASRISAKPGESEHQTGLAVDITSKSVNYKLVSSFSRTAEGKWIAENAHKFGFIIRYPKDKEDITGFIYEPWHIRYLGVELATEVYNSGLTFEEFLGQ